MAPGRVAATRVRLKWVCGQFLRDQRGSITFLILPMFMLIVFSTGLALDLVRYEAHRADIQSALDRGVLAAASLTQVRPAEEVVTQYLNNRTFSEAPALVAVSSQEGLNSRSVSANAGYSFTTAFLNIAGVPRLDVGVGADAIEGTGAIEISLVLDISGSMAREATGGTSQRRLEVLRSAASDFVDQMLAPANRATTTISLVPYSGQVNAGPFFNDLLAGPRVHNNSSCIEMTDADFADINLPPNSTGAQTPHFQWFVFERLRGQGGFPFNPNAGREAEWGWCPGDDQAVMPISNDPVALKARIAGLTGYDGTGTQIGLKWGLALLSDQTQPKIQALSNTGIVAPEFADRPGPFGPDGPQKIIVLMTDGNIRYQPRPQPYYYDSQAERDFWAFSESQLRCCSGGKLYARNKVSSQSYYGTLQTSSARTGDELFRRQQFMSLCDAAREAGIRVYTIGFDIADNSTAYADMSACATTPADFLSVQGLALHDAFSQVSVDIQKLRLTMR